MVAAYLMIESDYYIFYRIAYNPFYKTKIHLNLKMYFSFLFI